jgi:hypothetical protein
MNVILKRTVLIVMEAVYAQIVMEKAKTPAILVTEVENVPNVMVMVKTLVANAMGKDISHVRNAEAQVHAENVAVREKYVAIYVEVVVEIIMARHVLSVVVPDGRVVTNALVRDSLSLGLQEERVLENARNAREQEESHVLNATVRVLSPVKNVTEVETVKHVQAQANLYVAIAMEMVVVQIVLAVAR